MTESKLCSDTLAWAHSDFIKNDPESQVLLEDYQIRIDIGQKVYDIRTLADMTQRQLGDLAGVGETTIDELEQVDYEGDALAMLVRIAAALSRKVEIRLVSEGSSEGTQPSS